MDTSPDRKAEDTVVIYHTGHGVLLDDRLLLPMADTTEDVAFTAMPAAELTGQVLSGIVVHRLLIILDACYAATASMALLGSGMDVINRLKGLAVSPQVSVVIAARPYERAGSTEFSRAFVEAVGHRASGGHEPEYLPLDGVIGIVNNTTSDWQHARFLSAGEDVTEFLTSPCATTSTGSGPTPTRPATCSSPSRTRTAPACPGKTSGHPRHRPGRPPVYRPRPRVAHRHRWLLHHRIHQALRQHHGNVFAVLDRISTILRGSGRPCRPLLPPGHRLTLHVAAPHRGNIELTVGAADCRVTIRPQLDTDGRQTLGIAVDAHGDTDVRIAVDGIPATGRIEPPDGGERP
ncbi:hypothetical protein ACPPVO_24565 [Dactylosporangium sp. McL0621]|uniref:hypothetical protein n=1 Tax=Dactylosporangium sp. McL0621 TaxID=3415678 RepID=UPI003CF722FB